MMVLFWGIFGGFVKLGGQGAVTGLLILKERFLALDKNPLKGFAV
jgi:hypothetical protein